MSQRLALLIGMTAYPDDRLEPTATDAEIRALVDLLRRPENGRFDRVVPLLEQTAVSLQLGIAGFFEQSFTPDDLILFYFAGHSLIHHQNIYLAAADTFTEEYLDATTVEIDFIRRRLNACPARQVVLLDCGFSLIGATDRHTQGHEMLVEALQGDNRAVLSGAGLTGSLTAGLDGAADQNQDGGVTFDELRAYLAETVAAETPVVSAAAEDAAHFPLTLSQTTAVRPAPPPILPPPAETAAVSKPRRYGSLAALALLLLIAAFGFYAVSSGLFAAGGAGDGLASPTSTPTTLLNATALTNDAELDPATATQTPPASETAVSTPVPSATATRQTPPPATATHTALPSATPSPTATKLPTASPTATASPTPSPTSSQTPGPTTTPAPTRTPTAAPTSTPGATSAPVPMTIIVRQAYLRAGPGTNYRILAFPSRGTAVTIIGRNSDATWYNAILADGSRGWLHQAVIAPDGEAGFDDIAIAATIPAPVDDFFDPVFTRTADSLSVQVSHTYVGTQGENARFQARLLPETELVQPTYLHGQDLGLGLLSVTFNRVGEGDYTSVQVELCMVSEAGQPFYCETLSARKSW